MNKVSRSAYQKVCEENKRLKKDLELITSERLSAEKVLLIGKWREHFEELRKTGESIRELLKYASQKENL